MGKIDSIRGLEWVRLDTAFPRNPKVLMLIEDRAWRAVTAYLCGLSYSGEQGLDGFLPRACLMWLHATAKEARALVAVGLWHEVPGGWEINDWHDYQPSAEEATARRDKARKAAEERWKRERARQAAATVVDLDRGGRSECS